MILTLIAAVAANRVIGRGNDLPWRIASDLKHFKATTLGHPIIMGSNTWRSFGGRALPGRDHIVISSKALEGVRDEDLSRVVRAPDVYSAVSYARAISKNGEVFVVGGQNVYEQMINDADRMIISHLFDVFDGDRFFPDINPAKWTQTTTVIPENEPIPYRITTYERV